MANVLISVELPFFVFSDPRLHHRLPLDAHVELVDWQRHLVVTYFAHGVDLRRTCGVVRLVDDRPQPTPAAFLDLLRERNAIVSVET